MQRTNVHQVKRILANTHSRFFHLFLFQYGTDAVRHFFNVTAGLDSMVFGEYQIVNQVKEAYQQARENNTVGKIITRLFNKSLETNKKARNQTQISAGATSVSYVAVDKCFQAFSDMKHRQLLIIGAGETGELVIKKMQKKNVEHITICNRTNARAADLARVYNINQLDFEAVGEELYRFDVIVTATSAKQPLLTAEHINNALLARGHKKMLLVDLGVPRNIDPAVKKITGAESINVDDLESILQENQLRREAYVQDARHIIDEGVNEFQTWMDKNNLSPLLCAIKENFSHINQNELQLFSKNKSAEQQELLQHYANHITNKFSRMIIKKLDRAYRKR
ncbi:MAG: glutamyl-tRNA reductase [Bacteroidales bacterium]|nr:glutamyl-tRNA reductase [Bacteroidales bacterium]